MSCLSRNADVQLFGPGILCQRLAMWGTSKHVHVHERTPFSPPPSNLPAAHAAV